jgi:hypothetical protein
MRDHMTAMVVFFALAPRMPIDPPMTLCDEIADRCNKNPDAAVKVNTTGWVFADGTPDVSGSDDNISLAARTDTLMWYWLIDKDGWRPGTWPQGLLDALVVASSRYGIVGVS